MQPANNPHDLKTLILSYHPVIVTETVEEGRLRTLLQSTARDLRLPLYEWSVTQGLVRQSNQPVLQGSNQPERLLTTLEKMKIEGIFWLKDFGKYLKESANVRKFREVSQKFIHNHSTMVLSSPSLQLPEEVAHNAVYYQLNLPTAKELYEVMQAVVKSLQRTYTIKVALRRDELEKLLQALSGLTLNQARQTIAYAALEDGKLWAADIQRVMERKAQLLKEGGLLEYYPAEDNQAQLGGFGNLKGWLERMEVGFSDQARSLNLKPPKGIMVVGVQGCGKSLCAKVIARQWQFPLMKLDAGRLYDKYVGESEKNLRKVIALAESMAPVVLWIDEIEKGFSQGQDNSDGGLSQRLFGTFLSWLQEKQPNVFVVATANDLSKLPPELARKGRFDEIFFVDLPNDGEREEIFKLHLAQRRQNHAYFDLSLLVAESQDFSGAEIEQVIIAALYRALHLQQQLNTALILTEIRATIPLSVSRAEEITHLRRWAGDRFVSAG